MKIELSEEQIWLLLNALYLAKNKMADTNSKMELQTLSESIFNQYRLLNKQNPK